MQCASRSLLFSLFILLFPLSPFIPIQETKEIIEKELGINLPELMSAKQESGQTVLENTEQEQQQGKTEAKSTQHSSKTPKKHVTRALERLKKIYADM